MGAGGGGGGAGGTVLSGVLGESGRVTADIGKKQALKAGEHAIARVINEFNALIEKLNKLAETDRDFRDQFIASGLATVGTGQTAQARLLDFARLDETTPGEISPNFKLLSAEGLKQIRGEAAVGGAPGSGPSQIAQGRFLTGLAANEADRQDQLRLTDRQQRLQTLLSLAGFGANAEQGFANLTSRSELTLRDATTGLTRDVGSLRIARGGLQGAGRALFLSSIGQGISNFGGFGPGTDVSGGTSTAGGSITGQVPRNTESNPNGGSLSSFFA